MNNKCNKNSKLIFIILIFLLVSTIIISIFGLKKLLSWFLTYYPILVVIVSIGSLIYTIHTDMNYRKKELEVSRLSSNQIEFEKRLYNLLCIYDDLINDITNKKLEYAENDLNNIIEKKSLVRWNEIPIKYGNILSGITIKLDYLYGMVNSNYKLDEYKLFKERINGINNSVLKEFKHYADLNLKGTNINTKFSKIQYLIDSEQKTKNFDEVFDEIKDLIEEEGMLISSICFTIRDNKEDLYKLALNCINERAENINL